MELICRFMARLDKIKNLTGLAECFGKSEELQQHFNLQIAAILHKAKDRINLILGQTL